MPRIRTLNSRKPPDGWDLIEPALDELERTMREAVNDPHDGKRRVEMMWPIAKIHWQRTRYIYELYYKKKQISKELYEYCLQEKYADAKLISKWKKPGYEYLCSLEAIDKSSSNFGSVSKCRVPLSSREPGPQMPTVKTGCISCASSEASRFGGPIWWDSPRPNDLVAWAKAGCPTDDKPAKRKEKSKAAKEEDEAEAEDAAIEARLKQLRGAVGGDE